ncbi:MAG: dolichol-phosphate mannosyltransferase [Isosphaera sp.]|nr:dolichol-phosphate mannosyltransferase [Isosphaera sp.]
MEPRSLPGWLSFLFARVLFPGAADADTRVRRGSLLLVLLLPAAILYPTLDFHLLEPDEGRYAQIPKEMLTTGSWVVPTLQGEPYLDKPPLTYWLVALSYQAFGVSPAAARLVPAVCVHLTILAVYLIGRRSLGERAALWAALLLSVAPGFVCVARLLLLDGLLTLCVTVSVLCGFEAVRTGVFRPGWWLAAAVASGLGFLTKGPISEVLLFVPLWCYGMLSGTSARVRWPWYAVFFAVVFAVNVPWYLAMYRERPEFLGHFFWQHNVLRFLQPFDHLQPVWYYVPILVGGLLPGTILLAALGWRLVRGDAGGSPAGGFWLLAGLWCVFFFSCSGSKLPTYVLPAYPFLCLAAGEFVARTRWNTAASTRLMVGGMAAFVLLVHHVGVPWYARERSPFGRPELVGRFVADPSTAVVCFPRNCDSLAFYSDRSDLRNVRTRDVNRLLVACHHRPRTVILFTHRESLAGFRQAIPPSLGVVEEVSLRRTYGRGLLDTLFGVTPWGLCDVLVVEPRYHVPPKE